MSSYRFDIFRADSKRSTISSIIDYANLHGSDVKSVAFSADSKLVTSGSFDKTVKDAEIAVVKLTGGHSPA
jgi:WD40 repeat protein